jgi:hypothetical protein
LQHNRPKADAPAGDCRGYVAKMMLASGQGIANFLIRSLATFKFKRGGHVRERESIHGGDDRLIVSPV